MIDSFRIQGFRHFDDVEIKRLSHVNLIVGKNSAGKSTLLEALRIYCSKASQETISDVLKNRREDVSLFKTHWMSEYIPENTQYLFKEYIFPEVGGEGFKFSEEKSGNLLHVRILAYTSEKKEDRMIKRELTAKELEQDSIDVDDIRLVADFYTKNQDLKSSYIIRNIFGPSGSIFKEKSYSPLFVCKFVSTQGLDEEIAERMWGKISLSDSKQDVINGLSLIEDRVTDLAFVENERRASKRAPLVRLKETEDTIPLNNLGEGVVRIFHIILALVNARDGVLLIDEFENGLHWSVQPKIWEVIFKLAKDLNVQVFATTHSRDCIEGFQKAWEQNEEDGAFLRVDKEDGQASVREYPLERLTSSLETNTEVR